MSFESVNVMNKQELGFNSSKTVEHGHDALDSRMSCSSDREEGEMEDGEIDDDDEGKVDECNDSTSTNDKSPTKPKPTRDNVDSEEEGRMHNSKRHKDRKRRHRKEKRHHHVSHKRRHGSQEEQEGSARRDHSPSVKKSRHGPNEGRRPWDYDRAPPTEEDSGIFGVSHHSNGGSGLHRGAGNRSSNFSGGGSRHGNESSEDLKRYSRRRRSNSGLSCRDNDVEKESMDSHPSKSDERDSEGDARMQDLFSDGDDLDLDVAAHERDGAFQRPSLKEQHRQERMGPRNKKKKNKSQKAKEYWYQRQRRDEFMRRRDTERKRCRFYMEGRCGKADHCPYSHDFSPPKKLELCKFYAISSCLKGEYCVYMHDDFPCKFYHTGARVCKYEKNCKFSHDQLTRDTKKVLERFIEEREKENADGIDENGSEVDPFALGEEDIREEPLEIPEDNRKNSLLGSPPQERVCRESPSGRAMEGLSPGPTPPPFAGPRRSPQQPPQSGPPPTAHRTYGMQQSSDSMMGGPMGSGPMSGGPMGSGSMSGGPMGSGPMSGGPMGSGQMSGGPMGSGQMGGGPIGSRSMSGGPMGSGSMSGGPMGSGQIGGGPMGSGSMSGGPMGSGSMSGGPMGSRSMSGGPMGSGQMGGGPMGSRSMSGGPMGSGHMSGGPMGSGPMSGGPMGGGQMEMRPMRGHMGSGPGPMMMGGRPRMAMMGQRPPANMLRPSGGPMRGGGMMGGAQFAMGSGPPGYVDPQLDDLASMLVNTVKNQHKPAPEPGAEPESTSMLAAAGADDSDLDEEADSLDAMVSRMRKESEEQQRRQAPPEELRAPRPPFQAPFPAGQAQPLMQQPFGYSPQFQAPFLGRAPRPVAPPSSEENGAAQLYLRIAKQTATGRQEQMARETERAQKSPAAETPASPPPAEPEAPVGPREWKLIPLDVPLKTPYPLMRLPHDLSYSRSDPRLTGQLRLVGNAATAAKSEPSPEPAPAAPQPPPAAPDVGGRAYTPSMSAIRDPLQAGKDPRLTRAPTNAPEMPAALLMKPSADALGSLKLEIDEEPPPRPPPKMQLSERASSFQPAGLPSPQAESRAYLMDPRFRRRKASTPAAEAEHEPQMDASTEKGEAAKKDSTPVPSSGESSPID